MRGWGDIVTSAAEEFAFADAAARAKAAETGDTRVQPFAGPQVVAGHGTLGPELAAQADGFGAPGAAR
jgi:threonine dehydratase